MSIWIGFSQEGLKIKEKDVKFFNVNEEPFRIYGLPDNRSGFRRLPDSISEKAPNVKPHSFTSAGVRVRFETDSPYVAVRIKHGDYNFGSPNASKIAHSGIDLYFIKCGKQVYHSSFTPPLDTENGYEGIKYLPDGLKQITLYLPILSEVYALEVGIKENSSLNRHPDYKTEKPVVFYGSSITQGIAASRPGNIYESMISRNLDCNFVDLGFSGSCKGETALAEYISELEMSAFVFDYDHNAPDVRHLENTHEAFYKIIRNAQHELPIIFVTRPEPELSEDTQARRAVIARTFLNARDNGDKNVYLIDGRTFFGNIGISDCTADGTHPNDLGMYFMSQGIGGILHEIFCML